MAKFWKLVGDIGHWGEIEADDFGNAPCPFPAGDPGQILAKTADECGVEFVDMPEGIPAGGTTGQVLKKDSNTDYDVSWQDDDAGGGGIPDAPIDGKYYARKDADWEEVVNDLPTGGTTGQVLKKDSNTDYDVVWANDEGIPDAPADGEYYARKDGDWEIVPVPSFAQSRWVFTDIYTTGNVGSYAPYLGASVASGTVAEIPAALKSGTHQGGITIRSSTSANSGFSVLTDATALVGAEGLLFRCMFSLRASEKDRTVRIGFIDTTNHNAPTDGAFLEISNLSATAKCRNNSTESASSSASLSSNTWYTVDIEYLTSSSVEFTIFDDSNTVVLSATISTNVPNSAARVFGAGIVATNSGTSVRELIVIDYMGHGSARPNFIITP